MRLVRILEKGVVVIPAEARKRLGWEVGDLLLPEVEGNRLVLARVVTEASRPEGQGAAACAEGETAPAELAEEECLLLREIGTVPVRADRLCQRSGLPAGWVAATLIQMESKRLVRYTPYGYVRV